MLAGAGMNSIEYENFSKKLKELRTASGLTQSELSKELNMSRSCLANYEACKRRPGEDILELVADYFHVSVDYLIGRQSTCLPIYRKCTYKPEELNSLLVDGQLDISEITPAGKIAIFEFYNYLMDRERYNNGKLKLEKIDNGNSADLCLT